MTKEEMQKLIAEVVGYGVAGHGLDLIKETLEELDAGLAAEVGAISDIVYERFDIAAKQIERFAFE